MFVDVQHNYFTSMNLWKFHKGLFQSRGIENGSHAPIAAIVPVLCYQQKYWQQTMF